MNTRSLVVRVVSRALNILSLLALLGLMTEVSVAQIDRKHQPAADPAPKASFPSFEQFTLSNGLKVYFVRDPRPVVTFRLQVRGGASTDGKTPGLSSAAADLLTKGSKTHSALDFAQRIDFVGGSIGGSSSADMITVGGSGLKKHVKTILDLYAEAIKFPTYPADELGKYKQEQITALKASQADPGTISTNAVNRVLFGTTAYGLTPTEESLSSLTPQALASYHKTYFTPANSTLAVVGDFSVPELKTMLETAFSDWKKGAAAKIAAPKFPQFKGRRIVLVDRPTSVQSSIRVIGRGPMFNTPERPKTTILNSILGGGGLGDRFTMNLRETHSFTYSPFAYFNANLYQGYWVGGADVRNDVTDSALKEMLFEIDRIQREDVTPEELNRNVQSSTGRFLMSIAEPNVTAERVQFIDFYGLPKDYYNRLVDIYMSTTAADLRALARKYLASEDLAIVVVGKASEIKSKLEPFGKVEVWDVELNPVPSEKEAGASVGMAAEQVYAKMLDARGGKRKLQAITSLRQTSPIELSGVGPQPMTGTITMTSAAPNKRYLGIDAMGMKLVEMFADGQHVVQKQGGQKQEMTGADLEKALEENRLLREAWAAEMGATLAARKGKKIDGKETLALDITLPKSGTTTYFLDPATYLVVRTESEDGAIIYGGWKDVGEGVKMPSQMTLEFGPITIKATDIKTDVNAKIDDATFSAR
jgi:predicted Zn-dependent peptidase